MRKFARPILKLRTEIHTFKVTVLRVFSRRTFFQLFFVGKQAPFQGPIIDSQVDSKISSILTAWGVSGGVGIAIIRKDAEGNWIEERKGYGNATFEGAPITENTRFMIGSNSKVHLNPGIFTRYHFYSTATAFHCCGGRIADT